MGLRSRRKAAQRPLSSSFFLFLLPSLQQLLSHPRQQPLLLLLDLRLIFSFSRLFCAFSPRIRGRAVLLANSRDGVEWDTMRDMTRNGIYSETRLGVWLQNRYCRCCRCVGRVSKSSCCRLRSVCCGGIKTTGMIFLCLPSSHLGQRPEERPIRNHRVEFKSKDLQVAVMRNVCCASVSQACLVRHKHRQASTVGGERPQCRCSTRIVKLAQTRHVEFQQVAAVPANRQHTHRRHGGATDGQVFQLG